MPQSIAGAGSWLEIAPRPISKLRWPAPRRRDQGIESEAKQFCISMSKGSSQNAQPEGDAASLRRNGNMIFVAVSLGKVETALGRTKDWGQRRSKMLSAYTSRRVENAFRRVCFADGDNY